MLTQLQREQFSEILEELGKTLDITETQYNAAVKSYEAVGNWLSKSDSILAPYKPEILPQGSFLLGTMIQPISAKDDLDIDLVCQLQGKHPDWTQYNLKQKVGDQIKLNATYKDMLDEEGRRCWTLLYRRDTSQLNERYHMDILPCIVSHNYRMILEKAFSATELSDVDNLAIKITCTEEANYYSQINPEWWLKSNPFGYGKWFLNRATLNLVKAMSLTEAIAPVPVYRKEKLPLQRVVQILKRHRDMMFNGHEHKPISIIITTLAAKAYNKETDIITALQNVIQRMPQFIEERYSAEHGRNIKWISNPVNESENFADRWVNEPQREKNFYKWMGQVSIDLQNATGRTGLHLIQESMEKPFGKDIITKAFSNYGANQLTKRENNALHMAAGTGMLGASGRTPVTQHTNFGVDE